MTVTECNNSVFVTADDGARDRRMQSGAMDGVTKEEGSVMGPCNNSKIVIADGGARDQRMQSDATDGATGEEGRVEGTRGRAVGGLLGRAVLCAQSSGESCGVTRAKEYKAAGE